jgi:hypothetical protein
MFKMEARLDGRKVVLRLSGRMQATHLELLRARIDKNMRSVALDLEEVTLVDIDVVRFLRTYESQGIELRHCAPYIREWILRGERPARSQFLDPLARIEQTSNLIRRLVRQSLTLYSTEFHFASEDGSRAACMEPWAALIPLIRHRADYRYRGEHMARTAGRL